MDSKFYVSCEAARLLKEKGYDEECTTLYDCVFEEIIPAISVGLYRNECIKNDYYCSCPTKSEAIDWLDSKEVYIQIGGVGSGETQRWSYTVFDYKTCDNYASEYIYPTRLEAEEAAIIKALELL